METRNSALCIFDKQPVQTDIEGYAEETVYPLASPEGGGPIEFAIRGNAEHYIDVDNTLMFLELKVTNGDGKPIAAADKVALTNLPTSSLFSDVFLTLGETQIEGGQGFYPYKGMLATLLNIHPAAKKTHFLSHGWYADEAGKHEDETNKGFVARQELIDKSETVRFMAPLHLDFFNQGRYLISNLGMRLKFLRAKPEFALMGFNNTSTSFKIEIQTMKLYVRRMKINPSVINGHNGGLAKQNAHYPVKHTSFTSFTIPQHSRSYVKDELFKNENPRLMIVALVDNEAFNGSLTKNPYNFQHFDLNKLVLYRDASPFPGNMFEPDFKNSNILRSYVHTMVNLGYFNTDDTNGMTEKEFLKGTTLYAYDLTADNHIRGAHRQVDKGSLLKLELGFAKPLPNTVNVIVLGLCDSFINITQTRAVLTGYAR